MGADQRLDRMISAAEAAMLAATGGGAVCAITKSGASAPAAKYHEGRWAALRALRRARQRDPGSADRDAASLLAQWQADLERRQRAGAGEDWVAYLLGGVDALTEFQSDT